MTIQRFSPFVMAIWAIVGTASAQSTMQTDTATIDEAPVLAGFVEVDAQNSPRMLNVIGALEVGKTGANSVEDVLEFVPGVDVRSRGPMGIQTDLSIRGGSFEQTALWVDGIRWSAPQTGHHLMDLPIDPEDIDRVVVSRGGASGLWGAGAMAGAVSLQTGPAMNDGALLVVESGSNAWMRVKARADFGSDISTKSGTLFRHRISASRVSTTGTNGRDTNTDAMIFRTRYSGWLAGDWGTLKTSLGFADKAFGAQNFYTPVYPVQYEETSTLQGQASYTKVIDDVTLELSAYHRTHGDEFHLYRVGDGFYEYTDDDYLVFAGDTAGVYRIGGVTQKDPVTGRTIIWYQAPNNHLSRTTGGRLLWRWDNDNGETFVSVDLRHEYVKSNLLGNDTVPGWDGTSAYKLFDDRRIVDIAFGRRLEWNRFAVAATAAWNSYAFRGTRFVPSAEATIDLTGTGESFWFASANRSVRHPSFTDLYYTLGGAQGSANLKSEWSDNLESGVRINLTPEREYRVQVEQALFRRNGNDLIDWAKPNGSDTTFAVNLREVQFQGLETGLTISPSQRPSTKWFVNYARFGYSTMEASESSSGFQSNYVLDFIGDKIDASVGIEGPGELRLDARWSWQDRVGGYENRATGEEFEYDPFSLLSFTVSKTFSGLQLRSYLRMDNALDVSYVDIGTVQQPGRFVRIGFAYNVN